MQIVLLEVDMNTNYIEIHSYNEPGYKPQVDFADWRVALLNAMPMYLPSGLTYFDRHLETTEVFILLSGSAGILVAGQEEKPRQATITWLEEGKIYNVLPATWHTLFMMPGSKLAVIENKNTSVANSPRYYFKAEERDALIPSITL